MKEPVSIVCTIASSKSLLYVYLFNALTLPYSYYSSGSEGEHRFACYLTYLPYLSLFKPKILHNFFFLMKCHTRSLHFSEIIFNYFHNNNELIMTRMEQTEDADT